MEYMTRTRRYFFHNQTAVRLTEAMKGIAPDADEIARVVEDTLPCGYTLPAGTIDLTWEPGYWWIEIPESNLAILGSPDPATEDQFGEIWWTVGIDNGEGYDVVC